MMNQTEETIQHFGEQWTRYPDNNGYYASSAMFEDICSPLLSPQEVAGLTVADLGSGTGRIVDMLLQAGAKHVTAVEPSVAFDVLQQNLAQHSERVRCIRDTADHLPDGPYDLIVSIGCLHHIPNPDPVVAKAFGQLVPGGRFLIWVYGKEGNELYLALFGPLRALAKRLPDAVLAGICHILTACLSLYILLCHVLPLPMRKYMLEVLAHYGWKHRFLTIFDQLNPAYAKYYSGAEARHLLEKAGFVQVTQNHRHGYSWTVLGCKPVCKTESVGRPMAG